MAARLAYPDRPVILLSGDGSMGFTIADWESAVRQNLPFVGIVADDRAWGVVASGQKRRFPGEPLIACELGPIRFAQVAEACGAMGVEVSSVDEIGPAIERGLAAKRPCLIHVPIVGGGPLD
jgi:acetolactate synthase-1/2/3 large subunit